MSKIKLIYREQDYPNFSQGWIEPLVLKHFAFELWDPNQKYSKDTVVLATYQQDFDPNAWFRPFEQAGHRIVIDHLFDSDVDTPSHLLHENKLDLRSGHWLWYRTALLTSNFGYDQYRPQLKYTHDFLCLMNKVRDHRDRVMNELAPELSSARWSYVDRGHNIGDPQEHMTEMFWAYYMNPQWYNSTCWHLVVESYVRSDAWFRSPSHPNYRTEISEKSYKPLAYFQPFITVGSEGTLAWLHKEGFETFNNLWSEDYDLIDNDERRVSTVIQQVRDVVLTYNRHSTGWDKLTQDKLEHNHARFFDLETIKRRFDQEIIGDMMEFINR
jgi:hypothetical protein